MADTGLTRVGWFLYLLGIIALGMVYAAWRAFR